MLKETSHKDKISQTTACSSLIKKDYFSKAVQNKYEAKDIWKHIKSASNEVNTSSILLSTIKIYYLNVTGKQNVANAINNHFVNISKYVNKVDFNETNFDDLKTFLNNKLGTKHFSINFITVSEVSIFIDQLNKNKSAGIDGMGPKISKLCKEFLIQPLTALRNNCISRGRFPDLLKVANVVPRRCSGRSQ